MTPPLTVTANGAHSWQSGNGILMCHPQTSRESPFTTTTTLLSTVPAPCPHLQTEDVPRKFHGSSICCRWGSLFSYWWVSRSAGLCGFQQAPQRLPDGPSQDVAYCGCVSMGALQMEPPGVIRLLRRGVREGMGGGGLYEQQGVGDGHIFEVVQSLRTVMGWFFFSVPPLAFFPFMLRKGLVKATNVSRVICLWTVQWDCESTESYLLQLQGEEAQYLGQSTLHPQTLPWGFGLWRRIISIEGL